MRDVFLTVLSMSLTASYVVIAVIIVRFLLKKSPKIFSYALWAVVLFRLFFPFTFESQLSLIPTNAEVIPEDFAFEEKYEIDSEFSVIDKTVNTSIQPSLPPVNRTSNTNPISRIMEVGSIIWIVGITIILVYGIFSYLKLKRRLTFATLVNDNIYETDQIKTPFVLGIIRPRIFIPVNTPLDEIDFIIKHEQTHIKRYDYIIKPLSFIALTIHWFNPLIWLSYFLMSKDMEMSCDESVMKSVNEDIRVNYSNSLLSLSVKQSGLFVPLAFGESNVKARIKNILNYKKTSFWIFATAIVIVVIVVLALGTNQKLDQQYEFPLQTEDLEKVLSENEIGWYIRDHNVVDDTRDIFTLTNDDNITFGIDSQVRDGYKVLNMTWFLPDSLSKDKIDDFYYNELSKHFELAGIFYGNKSGLDKAFNELINYYLKEENYKNSLEWNKRVGNDHLKVGIRPAVKDNENQIISLFIMPHESYENYLRFSNESWKRAVELNNIKILNSTVAELKEIEAPIDDIDIFSKHFNIYGYLEDIKEIREVPESLNNINSSFLKPNKDKYLSAKLVDNSGSINVFLEMTSLNKDELKKARNHNIVMFYYNNEPIYVVSFSALYTEELRAQEMAKDFIMDLYTVNAEEINNYKSILSINTADAKVLAESYQINDEVLKSLMTSDAYDTLIQNRQNLMFTKACFEGNYTMQVAEIKLSENSKTIENIDNNKVGYNFELQLRYISNDGTEKMGTATGVIGLDKIDGNWKVTSYRNIGQ